MFSLKKLIPLTLLSAAFAAPSGFEISSINADDSVTVFQRDVGTVQCADTVKAIKAIESDIVTTVGDIKSAIKMVTSSQISGTAFTAELIALFGELKTNVGGIATQVKAISWSCVTFLTIPPLINAFINLFSNLASLFLSVLTYVITTKIAIEASVMDVILSIPATLLSALQEASEEVFALGLILKVLISQLKNVISTLLSHCSGCTNPFA